MCSCFGCLPFAHLENHRLESSYQNHLVLKVLVVSFNRRHCLCQRRRRLIRVSLTVTAWTFPFSAVRLLQLFRLLVLHRLRHAGHGAAPSGWSAHVAVAFRLVQLLHFSLKLPVLQFVFWLHFFDTVVRGYCHNVFFFFSLKQFIQDFTLFYIIF